MKKIILLFLLFALLPKSVYSQESLLDSLVGKFDRYRVNAFQEKIYTHLDRNFYLTGETMWFKIYAVDGSFHQLSDLSRVAYVEILDRADFAVLQGKIELKNGLGAGSFFLPASLSSGHYRIRVYTNWMKNFKPDFYYDQVFTLVNPFVVPENIPNKTTAACRVEFFPEGGDLVAGIESKVGFKVTDENGKGGFCQGFVLNNKGDTLSTFSPLKFGLGHFSMTPAASENYRAVLQQTSGETKSFPLPQVHTSGYVMQIHDRGDHLQVAVKTKGIADKNLYLFVHARQIIAHAERQVLSNDQASFQVMKTDLPEGISHFTLFNEALQPVCERLSFVWPRKALEIGVSANQKIFSPRKKVTLSLQTNIHENTPVPANLSLSVYKIDSLSTGNTMTIFPYLWLESDLTGSVESPEFYFSTTRREEAIAAMDNLMLTHGWRRFDWSDVLEGQPALAFPPEARGHIITGVITKDQVKQRSVFTYLGSPGKIVRAYGSWSNANGEVRFEIKDFYGPRRIILQTKSDTTSLLDIKIINPFSTLTVEEKLPPFRLREESREELLSRSIAMQVQDVFYYERYGYTNVLPVVDSSAFYGKADATYYLDDYTRFPVMEEVMREYVPGVFVRKRKDGFHFLVVDHIQGSGVLPGDPMVLLDGVPILDVDDIMAMDPLRIKKLDVVKRPYYLGQSAFSGVVSYTTYQGDMGGMQLNPRSVSLNYEGIQLKRQFHKPEYTHDQLNDRMPDQRYLLHWAPDITTDKAGKHQLEFYTSDVPGRYMVVAEGITQDGYAGTETYIFTVDAQDNQ